MVVTLEIDSFGRVVGRIEHNGAHATVTGSDPETAMADLRMAMESVIAEGQGECFWHEAMGEYRWLFRREGGAMRVAILWSIGTLTGWEHRFWAEGPVEQFRSVMGAAIEACRAGITEGV